MANLITSSTKFDSTDRDESRLFIPDTKAESLSLVDYRTAFTDVAEGKSQDLKAIPFYK
jgi:hypothetical protein